MSDRPADSLPILTLKGLQDVSSPSLLSHEVCFHDTKCSALFAVSHWINKHCLSGTPHWFYQLLAARARTDIYCTSTQRPKQKLEACHHGWWASSYRQEITAALNVQWFHLCSLLLRLFFSIEQCTKSLKSKSHLKYASELYLINIKLSNILTSEHANSDNITERETKKNKKRE